MCILHDFKSIVKKYCVRKKKEREHQSILIMYILHSLHDLFIKYIHTCHLSLPRLHPAFIVICIEPVRIMLCVESWVLCHIGIGTGEEGRKGGKEGHGFPSIPYHSTLAYGIHE